MSRGAHIPPEDRALHLDGCDCGEGQKLMTAKEYYQSCFLERQNNGVLPEISNNVKQSQIGKAVKWPGEPRHPLVCSSATAIFDPNSVLERGTEKCACWEYDDTVHTNNLLSSSGIFVSRPIDGLKDPEIYLHNSDIIEISNSSLAFSPPLSVFTNGLEGYVLEFDQNAAVYSEIPFWKFCNAGNLEIDDQQQHLLLLTKSSCIQFINSNSNRRLEKHLNRLMKIIQNAWLVVSNEEVIPIWYYGKNVNTVPREVRKYYALFDEFKNIIGPYSRIQQNNSSSTIIKKVLGMEFFHDRGSNNNYSIQNPLIANGSFWIQINYLHAYQNSLSTDDAIQLEIISMHTDIVVETHNFTLQQDAVQIWVKKTDGLASGNYYVKATANSSSNKSQSYPLGTGHQYFKVE